MENSDKQVPHLWWLITIFVLLMILKSPWIFNSPGPHIFGDELLYKIYAQNIFNLKPYSSAHFPPLYPMFLSLAFLSKKYWYEWMIFINIVLSSSIIFPVYLIGKGLLPKQAVFIPVVIVALLPFHVVYPSLLMSENLAISIFLFAIYFALIHNRNLLSAAMLGVFLALSYLTKYLFLPAIPFLIVVWWLIPLLKRDLKGKSLQEKLQLSGLAAVTMGFLIMYIPWLFYAHYSGISVGKAMGLFFVRGYSANIRSAEFGFSDAGIGIPNFESLVFWITAYASYLILTLAPFLFILCLYFWMRLYRNGEHQFKEKIFFLTVTMLTVGYLLLAIQHSWGAHYNYPKPNYLLGRYLMHLTPLYSIAVVIALYKVIHNTKYVKYLAIITTSLFSLLLIYAAKKILYEQAVWSLPGWFADINFNSPDSFVYRYHYQVILWGVFAIILFTEICLILCNKYNEYKSLIKRYMLPIVLGLLVFSQFNIFCIASKHPIAMPDPSIPLHGRILAPILKNEYNNGIAAIALKIDIPKLSSESLLNSLYFWGIPKSKVIVCTMKEYQKKIPDNFKQYFLSGAHYDYMKVSTYRVGKMQYYLYDITWDKITMTAPVPVIEDFMPKSTKAGVGFNVQPLGQSALWFRTRYATTSTVIVFKDVELKTTYGGSNFLSACVPNKLFKTSGKYDIYLLDKSTGRKSNPVVFTVK